jgi:DNA polymerase-1
MAHNLDDMAEHYLQHKTIKIEELIGSGKKQKHMDAVLTETVAEYAGEDALVAWHLYHLLKEKIDSESEQQKLLYEIEVPLLAVLAEMEFVGMTVDPDILRASGKRFAEKQALLEKEIYELAGHPFNIASPKQLATVLFTELDLRRIKKTKTGQSTDIEVLEELAADHPIAAKVAEHRQLAKLQGTYIEALPTLIHPKTRRIHSSFNQVVTATGRLSSSHPNLQNIPVRTAEGREIRRAFVPGKGFDLLLSCDYSQIELRVLAHFSGDDNLCESFRNDEDIHTRVASEVFGVSLDKVDSDMRRIAKTVNFGVIYGQSAFGLSKQLGIEQKEAQKFIDGYFAKYASIRQYLDSILDDCIDKGYVATLFGRRRYFAPDTIRRERKGGLNGAERMAINTVIQGTAADVIKLAMVKVMPLDSFEANLLLQIHDELVFEVTQKDSERLLQHVVKTMSLDQPLRVPLVVDAELATHWS